MFTVTIEADSAQELATEARELSHALNRASEPAKSPEPSPAVPTPPAPAPASQTPALTTAEGAAVGSTGETPGPDTSTATGPAQGDSTATGDWPEAAQPVAPPPSA